MGVKEAGVGTAGADLDLDALATARAAPGIRGFFGVHVGPRVDVATLVVDAEKLPIFFDIFHLSYIAVAVLSVKT